MTLKDKALEVIEWLVSDDLCEATEMYLIDKHELSEKDIKILANKIQTIYRFAHSVNPNMCYDAHADWRQELNAMYNKIQYRYIDLEETP